MNMTNPMEPTLPGMNRTPLEGKRALCELPWCGKINLRGDPTDARFATAAESALGVALPLEAHTTAQTTAREVLIFWLGPDEWLVHCPLEQTQGMLNRIQEKLAPLHHAATEVTDYYTVLQLQGEDAAAVLARGCPLDLHPRQFAETHCAQTRFGTASVLLYKPTLPPNALPTFCIQVRWSFTEYVWDYLASVIKSL